MCERFNQRYPELAQLFAWNMNPTQASILHTLLMEMLDEVNADETEKTLCDMADFIRDVKLNLDGEEPTAPVWWKRTY